MDKGQNLYKKAKKLIPGGTMLLSKRPEMFLPDHFFLFWSESSFPDKKSRSRRGFVDSEHRLLIMTAQENSICFNISIFKKY